MVSSEDWQKVQRGESIFPILKRKPFEGNFPFPNLILKFTRLGVNCAFKRITVDKFPVQIVFGGINFIVFFLCCGSDRTFGHENIIYFPGGHFSNRKVLSFKYSNTSSVGGSVLMSTDGGSELIAFFHSAGREW